MKLLTKFRIRQVSAQNDTLVGNGLSCGQSLGQSTYAGSVSFQTPSATHDTRNPSPSGLDFPQVEPIFMRIVRIILSPSIHPSHSDRLGRGVVAVPLCLAA